MKVWNTFAHSFRGKDNRAAFNNWTVTDCGGQSQEDEVRFVFMEDSTRIRPRSTGPYSFYGYYSCYLGFHNMSLHLWHGSPTWGGDKMDSINDHPLSRHNNIMANLMKPLWSEGRNDELKLILKMHETLDPIASVTPWMASGLVHSHTLWDCGWYLLWPIYHLY